MVCVFCLLPLFLLPLVNILPRLWDKLIVLFFRLIGREYNPPLRDGPSCPYKPGARKPLPVSTPLFMTLFDDLHSFVRPPLLLPLPLLPLPSFQTNPPFPPHPHAPSPPLSPLANDLCHTPP
ncbi:unnamed protein product [Closterium sp. NIES-54]